MIDQGLDKAFACYVACLDIYRLSAASDRRKFLQQQKLAGDPGIN